MKSTRLPEVLLGRNKQISDEALLDAAKAVFVEQGFGASTREIARRAGVSEAVLYQRHKTKLDLFFAAMIPPPLELVDSVVTDDAIEDIWHLSLVLLAYFREAMPVLLQLVTHPSFNLGDLAERESRMPLHRLGEMMSARFERHLTAGSLSADPERVPAAVLTLLSSLHSLAIFEKMGVHGGSFPDEAVRNIVTLVLSGLAPGKGGVS
jgi:AcrR family transcriptional regulator